MPRSKKSREDYIKDFIKIHKGKYIYDEFENNGSTKESIVICPIHGRFKITPAHHLRGHGCQKCGKESQFKTTEQFVNEAKQVHGNNYIYNHTDLNDRDEKGRVVITCRIHGDFRQMPYNHLYGYGCSKCKADKLSLLFRKSVEDFEQEASILHTNGYIYHQDYKNRDTNIQITCKKCGYTFSQTPSNHLQGKGCPICKFSHAEKEIKELLENNGFNGTIYQASKRHLEWLGKQSLDFYLPNYNIAIECQGIQHFESNHYFGGENELNMMRERDKRKFQLCTEHGIRILYYANYDYDFPYEVFTDKAKLLEEINNNDYKGTNNTRRTTCS